MRDKKLVTGKNYIIRNLTLAILAKEQRKK
jgi:hypothetical protein